MGERDTTLAVAVERHMNLMWHNISKAVAMKLFFNCSSLDLYYAGNQLVPVSFHRNSAKLMFLCSFV